MKTNIGRLIELNGKVLGFIKTEKTAKASTNRVYYYANLNSKHPEFQTMFVSQDHIETYSSAWELL